MDVGQYWEQIVAIATPVTGIIIIGAVKWIKNKLASSVVKTTMASVKSELGDENYNAIVGVVENYGVKKAITMGKEILNDVQEIKTILPLVKAMVINQIALGVYDENPELKETLEKLING